MSLIKFLISKTFFKNLAIAIVLLGGLVFGLIKWLDSTTNHKEFREVPNLIGKSLETAKLQLDERDLEFVIQDYTDYNPKFPKDAVLEQEPAPNIQVKEGRKIYLTLNPASYKSITVPVLTNLTKRQAEGNLKSLGFRIGEIEYKPHFAKDAVLELKHNGKKLEKRDQLPYTSVIDLVLGDGELNYGEKPRATPVEGEQLNEDNE